MKRFVLVANSPFTVVNFRKELILTLLSSGNEVHVICPLECHLVGDSIYLSELQSQGVLFHDIALSRAGMNPFSEFKLFLDFYRILKSISPDVVLNYTIKPTIYASLVAGLLGIRSVYSNITGLGFAFSNESLKSKLLSGIIRWQYKLALNFNKKVFFQNPDDLSTFTSNGLLNVEKAVLINGSGVDTKHFQNDAFEMHSAITFLFVGRLLKDKGIYEFIEAAKEIKNKYKNRVNFQIAGSFDTNPLSIKPDFITKCVNEGVIDYLGNQREIKSVYKNADVFVLPSYREGTPRSTLEAMSMSMPIITTDVPGCRETVTNGVNGFLVEVKKANALSIAMTEFMKNPNLIIEMGVKSREIAVDKYDVNKVNKVILEVINDD